MNLPGLVRLCFTREPPLGPPCLCLAPCPTTGPMRDGPTHSRHRRWARQGLYPPVGSQGGVRGSAHLSTRPFSAHCKAFIFFSFFFLESLPDAHTSQVPAFLELSVGEQRSAVLPPVTIRGRLAQQLLKTWPAQSGSFFQAASPWHLQEENS